MYESGALLGGVVASWPDVAGLRWLCNMVPTQRVSGCGVHIKSFQNLF